MAKMYANPGANVSLDPFVAALRRLADAFEAGAIWPERMDADIEPVFTGVEDGFATYVPGRTIVTLTYWPAPESEQQQFIDWLERTA